MLSLASFTLLTASQSHDGRQYSHHPQQGDHVARAEELGYFKFGGSTLLVLFEPGFMQFDDDLIDNSNSALETLVSLLTCPYTCSTLTNLADPRWHVDRPFAARRTASS